MKSEEKIYEELEKRVDELISLVSDDSIVEKEKEKINAFLREHWLHETWIDTAKAVLMALDEFQNKLHTDMGQQRDALLSALTAHVTSWFVGYDGLVADTREDLEELLDDIIEEAISDLDYRIPPFPAYAYTTDEDAFMELYDAIIEDIASSLDANAILGKVLDDIRL